MLDYQLTSNDGVAFYKMKLTNKQIKRLKEAGNGDCYVEDILMENASNFVEKEMPNLSEELKKEAMECYRDGL